MTTIAFIKKCLSKEQFKRIQYMNDEDRNEEIEIIDNYRKYLKAYIIKHHTFRYNTMTYNEFRLKHLCGMAGPDDIIRLIVHHL